MSVERTVIVSKKVNVPLITVLRALHDPVFLMSTGPLLDSYTADPLDPDLYEIVEKLTVLGSIHTTTKFKAKFTRVQDGMVSDVFANYGTSVKCYWKARSVDGGTSTHIEVENSVKCLFIFAPYIVSTLRASRVETLDKIASMLENEEPYSARCEKPEPTILNSFCMNPILYPIFAYACYLVLYRRLLYALVAGFILLGLSRTMLSKDPYGLFHLSLNKMPGEDQESKPRTEWLNMGYWKNTTIFPEACEALALKLIHSAGCQAGGNVLDVGHGSGESLVMQLSHPSVPRPSRLTGITSLFIHHQRSKDRVGRILRMEDNHLNTEVNLYHGDAVYRPSTLDHPLNPDSESPPFTTILALDCAYHFDTRYAFLKQSFVRLASGGRIALADICFTPTALRRHSVKLLATIGVIPRANLISLEQYLQDLREIGFVDVTMEDVSEDVFPGFVRFLQRRGFAWWIFGKIVGWYASLGVRFILFTGTKR